MHARRAAVVVVIAAISTLALHGPALGSRLPDPPPRLSPLDLVQLALGELQESYPTASLTEKPRIHNDIVLLTNIGQAAF